MFDSHTVPYGSSYGTLFKWIYNPVYCISIYMSVLMRLFYDHIKMEMEKLFDI